MCLLVQSFFSEVDQVIHPSWMPCSVLHEFGYLIHQPDRLECQMPTAARNARELVFSKHSDSEDG